MRVYLANFHSICRLNLKFESSAIHTYFKFVRFTVRNAIDDLGFLDQVIGIELSDLGQVTGIALRLVRGVERRMFPDLSFYLSSKFEIREFCYTYVLYFLFDVLCAMQSTIWVFWIKL